MSEKLTTIVYAPKGNDPRPKKIVLGKYMEIGEPREVPFRVAKTLRDDKDIKIVFSKAQKVILKKEATEKRAAEKAAKELAEKEAAKKAAKELAEKEAAEKAAKEAEEKE